MKDIVIVSACRTAIGKFGGSLAGIPAPRLGAIVIAEVIRRAGISGENIDEVIMGQVLQSGLGQGPARQAAVWAGIPESVPAMTINNICGSGLKAVALGAGMISAGEAQAMVVGGMENMSAAPYAIPNARYGYKMNNGILVDTMIQDSLTDAFENYHMGVTAENVARKYHITREEQDVFAALSQQKAEKAIAAGIFDEEIVPVTVQLSKKEQSQFHIDEFPRAGVTAAKLADLKPAFDKEGTVTAGNSSGINDGAAAFILMSNQKARELLIKPLARIVSTASAGVDHQIMGIGPVPATLKALTKANLTIQDIDLFEANEAFAAQSIAVSRELGLDPAKVNVNGGAIALGHPVGASGARILVSLLYELKRRKARYGLATLCVGGGMGVAVIIENIID